MIFQYSDKLCLPKVALDIFLQFRMSNKSHGRLNQNRINWCMNNLSQKYYLVRAQAPVDYSSWWYLNLKFHWFL